MIETKIAQIIDETRFVLAAGKEQGVREGMEFVIYELGPEIFDPETKQSLGRLELIKGKVKVFYVQDKLSTARTRLLSSDLLPPPFPIRLWDEYEKLPIESQSLDYDKRLTVRLGDRVRSVDVKEEVTPDAVTGGNEGTTPLP